MLLLDEPTINMDSEAREQTYRIIKRLKEDGVSILLATHEFHTVAHLCDAQLSLESGSLRPQLIDSVGGERKIIPCGEGGSVKLTHVIPAKAGIQYSTDP